MFTECSACGEQQAFDFGKHFKRRVTARFDGGRISSDGGAVLLGEVDRPQVGRTGAGRGPQPHIPGFPSYHLLLLLGLKSSSLSVPERKGVSPPRRGRRA